MSDVRFLTVSQFKSEIGAEELEVLLNPKTGKMFMSANGENYKVQGDIDEDKPLKVLIPEGKGTDDACLINPSAGAETKFVL